MSQEFGIGVWRTRDGRRAEVSRVQTGGRPSPYPLKGSMADIRSTGWTKLGRFAASDIEHCCDLISPWEESQPTETETLRVEIEELREALSYLLEQTVDQDLKYGIGLSEGEEDARQKALALLARREAA